MLVANLPTKGVIIYLGSGITPNLAEVSKLGVTVLGRCLKDARRVTALTLTHVGRWRA